MPDRNRMHAHKRFVIEIEHRAFGRYAINWVWPIQHNDCDAAFLAGAHTEVERPNKSIVTRADVLKIDPEDIKPLQHFCRRFAMVAVKTVDRDVQTRMLVTFPFHHVVLCLTEKAVLRAEKGGEAKQIATVSLEDSRRMLKLRGNRSRMNQRADTRAAKLVRPKFWQMIKRQFDAHSCSCITLRNFR